MTLPLLQPGESEAALVEAFLRAHPTWLAEHPGLYRLLAPPVRVHGEQLADHMAAMVHAERAHAAAMAERADNVLAAGRAAAGLAARVQEAVLALLRSADPVDCIGHEMPGILGVDAVHLCLEALHPGARPLPQGTVARLLEGRQVLFREVATDARLLHAEAAGLAGHDALALVPGEGSPALLALLARDPWALDPGQGAGALAFLGRAVAAALGR
ncbi:MAG TPA: hypothetical protein VK741_24445 [Acetobacteraceae bacterium]|jgi:uncharacterized protein YigA (DUF484 family)|nr:hypothetical protein [Acetobacteraceae bacterium]